MTFNEHDVVVLTEDLPATGLRRGDVGTVVHVHDRSAYEVEFTSATGDTIALLPLVASQLRAAAATDVIAVRSA